MSTRTDRKGQTHLGGQFGLLALLCMLVATGCVALMDSDSTRTNWLPGWANVAKAQNGEIPAQGQTVTEAQDAATFIVRFDDEPVLDEVGKSFRRDEAGARAKFESWREGRAALEGLTLKRASFSGELILGLPIDSDRSAKDVLKAMRAMDNLAYAEMDAMASTGAK